jgi:hypothetical protein
VSAHAPEVRYLCDDPDCCDDGCPRALCREDGQDWPCAYRREQDGPAMTARNERWRKRVEGIVPRPDGHYRTGRVNWS